MKKKYVNNKLNINRLNIKEKTMILKLKEIKPNLKKRMLIWNLLWIKNSLYINKNFIKKIIICFYHNRLASNAVNLNIKLMKWRLLPELDLDKISE